MKTHKYNSYFEWTGNTGKGTENYTAYARDFTIKVNEKADILGSSDPSFRGDRTRHNPEDLLISSISSCHALWYLHLCAFNNVVVLAYYDNAEGTMTEREDGGGKFTGVVLKPVVVIKEESKIPLAISLHEKANALCFIANSCNFPIHHEAKISADQS